MTIHIHKFFQNISKNSDCRVERPINQLAYYVIQTYSIYIYNTSSTYLFPGNQARLIIPNQVIDWLNRNTPSVRRQLSLLQSFRCDLSKASSCFWNGCSVRATWSLCTPLFLRIQSRILATCLSSLLCNLSETRQSFYACGLHRFLCKRMQSLSM